MYIRYTAKCNACVQVPRGGVTVYTKALTGDVDVVKCNRDELNGNNKV